jgi:hypothetical protein
MNYFLDTTILTAVVMNGIILMTLSLCIYTEVKKNKGE